MELTIKKENLLEHVLYQEQSIVSKILLKKPNGNLTLFAFDEGQSLAEHTSPYDAVIYLVEGDLSVSISGQVNEVKQGEYIILPANLPHGIMAISTSKFLLIMIK